MITRRGLLGVAASVAWGQKTESSMFADAEAYERFMGRWSHRVAPPLVEFAGVPDGGTVLDIGSGTGALAFEIAKRRPKTQVVGIDPSKEYVAFANARSPYPDRTRFQTGDARQMSFAGGSFSAALSLLVFNFIPDPGKALREARRVVKPGGWVTAAVWDYGAGMRMLRVFWDAAVSLDAAAERLDEKHMRLCREGELVQLWRTDGLEQVTGRAIEITTEFQSFPDYWDAFLLGQGPAGHYTVGLTSEHRAALRREVMRRLAATEEARPFALPARVWAVRGQVASG